MHYARMRRWGDPLVTSRAPAGSCAAPCSVAGCDRLTYAQGRCSTHYTYWRRTGRDQYVRPVGCSVIGCAREHEARGWCSTHYERWRKHGDPNWQPPTIADPLARFHAFYTPGRSDDCWEYRRRMPGPGYGWVWWDGRNRSAHSVAYELHSGQPIPDGIVVMHACDNPPCVNPAHLKLGTHAENMADMRAKGRQKR